ncbi:MAG: cold shock domain-containing protein [Campylobacter sp.]
MKGFIKSCLDEKKYGFIKGDDKKDYFFLYSSVEAAKRDKICDYASVEFEPNATPKGYSATKITILDKQIGYEAPSEFITTKSDHVNGYEIVEPSNWIVCGSSRDLDEAKADMIERAKSIGANSLIGMRYSKGTGNEGNYYYSIHDFSGVAVNLGKKAPNGEPKDKFLQNIDEKASDLKKRLKNKTLTRKILKTIIVLFFVLMAFFSYKSHSIGYTIVFGLVGIFIFFGMSTNRDWWLVKMK